MNAPTVINQTTVSLTEAEFKILKKGPRFIINDPKRVIERKANELKATYDKIRAKNAERGWSLPLDRLDGFIHSIDTDISQIHNSSRPSRDLTTCRILQKKLTESKVILRKTDKSKVFHLGTERDYEEKVQQYMTKTDAYENLGDKNPLEDLVSQTNSMLKGLLAGNHIDLRLHKKLQVDVKEAELAHLYFLPKAHKPGTPLRPIVAGLKSPTIKISKWLDSILRPLFDQMAADTSILNGIQLISVLEQWSTSNLNSNTLFLTMDVSDLYTMVPQEGGVQAIKKMLRFFHIEQIQGVKTATILLLARFVMRNNYFVYSNCYYKQIRGGAMGSPLTLTVSNAYMFFFQTPIIKWVRHRGGIFCRYIDDIFLTADASEDLLIGLVRHWNRIDENIKLSAEISQSVNFLDVLIKNIDGHLSTSVYHKPSHEPYFLPFDSTHAMFMKKNIPYGAIIRAIRYSSDIVSFSKEETHITMALLLNGYPLKVIQEQFSKAFTDMNCTWPDKYNYQTIRQKFLAYFFSKEKKKRKEIDLDTEMIFHFSYCKGMETFAAMFHKRWEEFFSHIALSNIKPIVGFRNCESLQQRLVKKKPAKDLITIVENDV